MIRNHSKQLKKVRAEQPSLGHKEAFSLAVAGWTLLSATEKADWAPVKINADCAINGNGEKQDAGPAAGKRAVE